MYMCLYVCGSGHVSVLMKDGRVPDVLELDLELLVSQLLWALGLGLWSSVGAVFLTLESLLLSLYPAFLWEPRIRVLMLAHRSLLLPMSFSVLNPPRHPHPALVWIVFLALQLSVDGQQFRAHHGVRQAH